jgi:hypothetical protein
MYSLLIQKKIKIPIKCTLHWNFPLTTRYTVHRATYSRVSIAASWYINRAPFDGLLCRITQEAALTEGTKYWPHQWYEDTYKLGGITYAGRNTGRALHVHVRVMP